MLQSLSDLFGVSITVRLRLVFWSYTAVNVAAAVWFWWNDSGFTDWDWLYRIGFPIAAVCTAVMAVRPRIGTGSIWLFPTIAVALARLIDLWQNYLVTPPDPGPSARQVLLGSLGWSFLVVSILYIDLLESKIYHRLVAYEQRVG